MTDAASRNPLGVLLVEDSPRIAERVQGAGFGQVVQTRPAFDDVVRTLESRWSRP